MAKKTIPFPKLGVDSAEVVKLLANAGDSVVRKDYIVFLQSGKYDIKVATPTSGRLEKIHMQVGDEVRAGDYFITIDTAVDEDSSSAQTASNSNGKSSRAQQAQAKKKQPTADTESASLPARVQISERDCFNTYTDYRLLLKKTLLACSEARKKKILLHKREQFEAIKPMIEYDNLFSVLCLRLFPLSFMLFFALIYVIFINILAAILTGLVVGALFTSMLTYAFIATFYSYSNLGISSSFVKKGDDAFSKQGEKKARKGLFIKPYDEPVDETFAPIKKRSFFGCKTVYVNFVKIVDIYNEKY